MKKAELPTTQREIALQKINTARGNLLLMIALTVINILLYAFGSDSMLLFSATLPYYSVVFGFLTEDSSILIIGITIAIINILLYLLCWVLSKKNYIWMIVALVLFILDSFIMVSLYIYTGDFSGILDIAIHLWVLYYLITGAKFGKQLKSLPPEEEEVFENCENPEEYVAQSTYLRRAHTDIKFRVLIEGEYEGHKICFRRVKRTNELVIDGYVYDEIEMLIETPHELKAHLNETDIAVGYNGTFSYIAINGKEVAKKLRLI